MSHEAFCDLVARTWEAGGWETTVDGPVVVINREGEQRRLLVLQPGFFQGVRKCPEYSGSIDRVVAPTRLGRWRGLRRGCPDVPVIEVVDVYDRLQYGVSPGDADAILQETMGIPFRDARWDETDSNRFAHIGIAALVIVILVGLVAGGVWVSGLSVLSGDPPEPTLGETDYLDEEDLDSPDPPSIRTVAPEGAVAGPAYYVGRVSGAVEAHSARDGGLIWRSGEGGSVIASPVVADGVVYAASTDGSVTAFNALTGAEKWNSTPSKTGIYSSPTLTNGTVYVRDGDGNITALDARSGEIEWTFSEARDASFRSPTVADRMMFLTGFDGQLYAIDAERGEIEWTVTPPETASFSAPVIGDGVVVVSTSSGEVRWLTPSNGSEIGSFEHPANETLTRPTVVDGTTYVRTHSGQLFALDPDEDVLWSVDAAYGGSFVGPAVHDGTAVAATTSGEIMAINTATGDIDWSVDTIEDRVFSSPTVTADNVYVGTRQGAIYALDRDTGEQRWDDPTNLDNPFAEAIEIDDTVFVPTTEASLHAIDSATGYERWHFNVPPGITAVSLAVVDDPFPEVKGEDPRFEVLDHSAPDTEDAGDRAHLRTTVYNAGANGSQSIEWSVDGETLEQTTISIPEQQVRTVEADIPLPSEPTEISYVVSVPGDNRNGTINLVEPPRFEITTVDEPDPIGPGEAMSVSVEIRNTGDRTGTGTVSLHLDGIVVDEHSYEIPANQAVTRSLNGSAPSVMNLHRESFEQPLAVTTPDDRVDTSYPVDLRTILPSVDRRGIVALAIIGLLLLVRSRWRQTN